jgi:hypothetical protein
MEGVPNYHRLGKDMEPNEKKSVSHSSTFHPSIHPSHTMVHKAFSFRVRNFAKMPKIKREYLVTIHFCFFSEKFPDFNI